MKKVAIDPAYPERYPEVFRPTICKHCTKCWFDMRTGKCLYGGPFEFEEFSNDQA